MSRSETMEALTKRLPLNKLGLPKGIFRLDLLNLDDLEIGLIPNNGLSSSPESDTTQTPTSEVTPLQDVNRCLPVVLDEPAVNRPHDDDTTSDSGCPPASTLDTQQQLKSAYELLSYSEGYPALLDGRPFWSRLEFEPAEAFEAFQGYLTQGQKGARQLFVLSDEAATSIDDLRGYLHFYYWIFRARAFDLFRTAEAKKMRHERAIALDDEHYVVGENLLDVCKTYMEGEEFVTLLTPKTAMEGAKLAIQLQRVSSGLPVNGPSGHKDGQQLPPSTNISVIMGGIVQQEREGEIIEGSYTKHTNPITDVDSDDGNILRSALVDPETARLAQELVVRIQHGQRSSDEEEETGEAVAAEEVH